MQRETEKERTKTQMETHVHVAGQEAHLHATSVLLVCSKENPKPGWNHKNTSSNPY